MGISVVFSSLRSPGNRNYDKLRLLHASEPRRLAVALSKDSNLCDSALRRIFFIKHRETCLEAAVDKALGTVDAAPSKTMKIFCFPPNLLETTFKMLHARGITSSPKWVHAAASWPCVAFKV